MLKLPDIREQAAQRLRELFPKARAWEESFDARVGNQTANLLVKFRLGDHEHMIVLELSTLGQPRQIRAAVTRLDELRREMPTAYPAAAAVYIGPESARILKSHNLGYIDLSGNCHLALENVLIEKEGKRNTRASARPLRSLFAPRATRVVRVLLSEVGRAWRLGELARAAEVSLGHSHNVVKRLEELAWLERDTSDRMRLGQAGRSARELGRRLHLSGKRDRVVCGSGAHDPEVSGRSCPRGRGGGAAIRIDDERRVVAGGAASQDDRRARLPRGESGSGGGAAGPARGGRGRRGSASVRPLRSRRVLTDCSRRVVCGLRLCLSSGWTSLDYDGRGADQAQHLRREAMGY